MKIIPYKSFWLTLSALFVIASIVLFSLYGLKLSADFTEGTLIVVQFVEEDEEEEAVAEEGEEGEEVAEEGESVAEDADGSTETNVRDVPQEEVRAAIESFEPAEGEEPLGKVEIKKGSDASFLLKMARLSEEQSETLLIHLSETVGQFDLLQSRNVSPTFAKTFRDKAILALIIASVMIIVYITFAFRRVSRGVKSWKLGVCAIAALLHDLLIIIGIFVLLGQYFGVEIDGLFITALLSVMGFSVNDTIVVFDRVRENLLTKHHQESFEEVAERSLQQTLARSINTSFSTLLVLVSLLIFGAHEIFYFVLALALGVAVGTYSSIFLATPLLTVMQKREDR